MLEEINTPSVSFYMFSVDGNPLTGEANWLYVIDLARKDRGTGCGGVPGAASFAPEKALDFLFRPRKTMSGA